MSIADKLLALNTQRQNLATNLTTKGVASVGTETLAQLVPKVLDITSGGGTPTEGWQPPSDWIDIDNVVDGNINLLVADTGLATYAFICTTSTGQYHVDWGDGTSNNYNSYDTAQHTYEIGTGQPCSRGYTTFKMVISPVSGNITRFYVTAHSLAKQIQEHGYLWCVYGATYTTSLANAFYSATYPIYVHCRILESFKATLTLDVTVTMDMFYECYSLINADISGMTNLTNANGMFFRCYSLKDLKFNEVQNIIDATRMFYDCYSLNILNLSNMTNVTTVTNIFYNCYSLQKANISSMTNITTANSMFFNCYSLQSVESTNFGLNASTIEVAAAFTNCEQLTNINLPNAKLTKIAAKGVSGKLNKLETLTFSPSSTFSGLSPQIDIAYNTLTAEQLNTIFTDLPTLTGKTITITGCSGASTCDRTIATAKGWTVTG